MSELDGGGWTLVWQHSYMEDLPLNLSMRYFSEDYTPCVTRASGWCNIPNKARFNPTEQMIVVYHKGTIVYAYKGLFNRNIDHNWSGAILLDFKKIVDKCSSDNGVQPAPQMSFLLVLHLTRHHHITTHITLTRIMALLQVLIIVDGKTVCYHHLFQALIDMFK